MSTNITDIGHQKVKNIETGEAVELKSFWDNQDVAIVFFRRWGCMFCRLWAKELSEISQVLKKNNVRLVGIGVEETGSKDFIKGKFFDGDLFYVEDISTYHKLGFKRFNVVSIITSLFWKQSREAIMKGRSMDLGGDLKGDWVQIGGAILVKKGGNLLKHFVQTGPGEHLSNSEILKHFGLEHEYNPETMANKNREQAQCTSFNLTKRSVKQVKSVDFELNDLTKEGDRIKYQKSHPRPWRDLLKEHALAPIHNIWMERKCKREWV